VDRRPRDLELVELVIDGVPTGNQLLEIWESHSYTLAKSFDALNKMFENKCSISEIPLTCNFDMYQNSYSMHINANNVSFSESFRKKFEISQIETWWPCIDVSQMLMVCR
jgi:hypothetical protein